MSIKILAKQTNPHQAYRVRKLYRALAEAESYDEWKEVGLKLDVEMGNQEWKLDNRSVYFDAEIISHRLTLLRRYRQEKRVRDLMQVVAEGLSFDIANISHPMLFSKSHVGTKKIIEDYIYEMTLCLDHIVQDTAAELSIDEKFEYFRHCQRAYGQPAIMFSGGATLGLFHTGVCKALMERDLMPKVLSGSSAGAIMTAMLGVSKPENFHDILNGDHFFHEAFQFRNWADVIKENSGIADVRFLKQFLIRNLGDMTFGEALKQSGLYINVAIAPYDASQEARIMNAYTSPDLLIWSAVLASCAVPVLFPPVRLTSKRVDGKYTPYMATMRWVDGSVRSDFPQEKMARLYNLNYTIASQVNPHVVPFMQTDEERYRKDMLSWPERILRRQAKVLAKGAMDFTRERMGGFPTVRRLLDHGYGIIDQRYYGNVNIIGDFGLRHYTYMLQNPRPHLFKSLQREGERATWPKISSIETLARVGKTIEHCLEYLVEQERIKKSQTEPECI